METDPLPYLALDGLDVIMIEKSNATGGNGVGVEGMFAIKSELQKEQGIEIEPADILTHEMEEAQYAGDYSLWTSRRRHASPTDIREARRSEWERLAYGRESRGGRPSLGYIAASWRPQSMPKVVLRPQFRPAARLGYVPS